MQPVLNETPTEARPDRARLRIDARGVVQGVGFRPYVYRLATELGLKGWVSNTAQGAVIEVEGPNRNTRAFATRLEAERPPLCSIHSLELTWLDPAGYQKFEIRTSADTGTRSALILPDIATCEDCRREIFDPSNRRFFYPFTNCTNCGPRFTIIERLPYDRPHTAMRRFRMCRECQLEYDNPGDRRFHAQPNACPVCGPQVWLTDAQGRTQAQAPETSNAEILRIAASALKRGEILALKGLGGFHLLVVAGNAEAVRRLRERKHREEKPFAVMFPTLESAQFACEVSELETRLLRSPAAPIVLLRRRGVAASATSAIPHQSVEASLPAPNVAPGNPYIGAMLPYTPLHHLLLSLVREPLVATSGNLSDEPICIENEEALVRLAGIADVFLLHDRPILRHVDDSILRVVLDREMVLRRARGFAPLPLRLPGPGPSVLATGAHLKNTIALTRGEEVFVGQHIGDLDTEPANAAFETVTRDLQVLLEIQPEVVAADLHPDYVSTRAAQQIAINEHKPLVAVQHHVAHVFACLTENELKPPVLGVAWDGTGLGTDASVWGGEFFVVEENGWRRFAHLRPFRLPGGEAAIKEPRRSALGIMFELTGTDGPWPPGCNLADAFSEQEIRTLRTMISRGVNSPVTTSAGRLFDAVAALVGLRHKIRFEGQAAMELEFAAQQSDTQETYPWRLQQPTPTGPMVLDWEPMIEALLRDVQAARPVKEIAAGFHNSLAELIVLAAREAKLDRVLLTGGCFQNAVLLERAVQRLREEGLKAYWHQRVPPGDGGISLGQAAFTRWSKFAAPTP